jgi:TPR repeat protein
MRFLIKAFLLGCATSAALTGVAYAGPFEDGRDAVRRGDVETAIRLWEPLGERGDVKVQFLLGVLYSQGKGIPEDWGRAGVWFRRAANQGDAASEYFVALMNLGGLGTPKDEALARDWALRSANAGYVKAETLMGAILEVGPGRVPKDYAGAMEWYRKAAQQNDAAAQTAIGRLYENGQGVGKDYNLAAKWYRTASDNPHTGPGSKLGLARMYEYGYGVNKDPVEALVLYCVAMHMKPIAQDALSTATSRFEEISKTLTPSQIADANGRCQSGAAQAPNDVPP